MTQSDKDRLTTGEVADGRDVSPRGVGPNLRGKRVRAIPYSGGTMVEIRHEDFANGGIDHPLVRWINDRDNFTVPVGPGSISQEAADYLTSKFPMQFEYMNEDA
jgi:hypothetical protein